MADGMFFAILMNKTKDYRKMAAQENKITQDSQKEQR